MADKLFRLNVLRPNGTGVANAEVRLIDPQGTNVIGSLLGRSPAYTDAYGVINEVRLAGTLPSQPYIIQVIAPGFNFLELTTEETFVGTGIYTVNLTRPASADGYSVIITGGPYRSSMVPDVFQVESTNDDGWEKIRANIEHIDGYAPGMEAPVERASKLATLDVRNRVRLGVRPTLVKEPEVSAIDPDFSCKVDISFASITQEGEAAIGVGTSRSYAQTLPPDGEVDLLVYSVEQQKRWIVPVEPVTAFRGFYQDVMVWLVGDSEGSIDYTLTTQYLNGAGQVVDTTTATLTSNDQVQRIRLNTDPASVVQSMVLVITTAGQVQPVTKPLTVVFRD